MQELTSQFSKDTVVGDQILLPRDIYVEDSVQNKLEVSSKILGKEQIINITQSDNVAPKCLLKKCNNVVVNIYNK
jgi:hypothetical protein